MHEQKGSFQGVDTCDITNFGDFSKTSILLDENESRSIMNRPDINVLLTNLQKQNVITEFSVNGFRERAKIGCPSEDVIRSHVDGSTYISAENAMKIQQNISEDQCIRIKLDDTLDDDEYDENVSVNEPTIITCKRNWPPFIVFSQLVDSEGYGCNFPLVPYFNKKSIGCQIIWSLSEMLTKIPHLWLLTDEITNSISQWQGWLLTYLATRSFPSYAIKGDSKNPFKRTFVSKMDDLINKMGLEYVGVYDFETMFTLFVSYSSVFVTENINGVSAFASQTNDIIIVVPGNPPHPTCC